MTLTVSAGDCDYQDARSELAEGGASCAHSNSSSSSLNPASTEAAHSEDLRGIKVSTHSSKTSGVQTCWKRHCSVRRGAVVRSLPRWYAHERRLAAGCLATGCLALGELCCHGPEGERPLPAVHGRGAAQERAWGQLLKCSQAERLGACGALVCTGQATSIACRGGHCDLCWDVTRGVTCSSCTWSSLTAPFVVRSIPNDNVLILQASANSVCIFALWSAD